MTGIRNTIARLSLAVVAIGTYVAMAFFGAAVSHADIYCTTSRMSGMTFTTCRYSDPWRPATTETCWDRTGYCTTREG